MKRNKKNGGNDNKCQSCHNFDDNIEKCQNTTIKKNLCKYTCQFIVHDSKLSQCIKKGHLGKYKDYTLYKKSLQQKKRDSVLIPKINKNQIKSDLNRYLSGKVIILYYNDTKIDSNVLKSEKIFLKKFPNSEKLYIVIKTLLSPGFHNDDTINTFKHCNFTRDVFKTKQCVNYIMCSVNIEKIIIKIKYNLKYSLYIEEKLKGNLQCFKDQNIYKRDVSSRFIVFKWDEKKPEKVNINYYNSKKEIVQIKS